MVSGVVAVTAVMPSSHVTVGGPRKFARNQALVTHGGARKKNASARRARAEPRGTSRARGKKRNGLAIRMRDVPAKVSFRLGLTDRREGLSGKRISRKRGRRRRRRSHLIARLIASTTVHVATGRAPPSR